MDVLQIDHEQGHCLVVLSKRCEYLYQRALDSRCMLDLLDDETLWEQVDTTVLGLDAERAKQMPYIASMGIYVVSKEAMISLLRDDFPDANDFGSEVIPGATKLGMKVRELCIACTVLYKDKLLQEWV